MRLIHGGNRSSSETQTYFSPASLFSSSWGLPRRIPMPEGICNPPVSSGSTPGPTPRARKTLKGKQLVGILIRCLNHLSWLLLVLRNSGSKPSFLDDQAPHTISKAKPSHPPKEAHFSCLNRHCFTHNPDLVIIGEGWNEDGPLNLKAESAL